MDTSREKLNQRLSAQEMIKANGAAEAAELSRMKQQLESYEELFEKFDKILGSSGQQKEEVQNLVAQQKEEVQNLVAQQNEDIQNLLSDLKSVQESQMQSITEYVHKENVKVYRNVQAVVLEEMGKLGEHKDPLLTALSGKVNALFGLSIITLLVSLSGVVFLVLQYLGII